MILVVNLSPAWQRTLFFDNFHLGEVNRVRRVFETASGKGVNVARVLKTLGAPVRLLTIVGGERGKKFRRAVAADRLNAQMVLVRGETRFCQTLVSNEGATELVEEAPSLRASEVAAVLRAFDEEVEKAAWVVLSGTVPPGCGDDFYARLTRAALCRGVPVVVDAQRAQLMNAVRERPTLVKINRAELAAATGKGGVDELKRLGAEQVVITNGAKPVIGFDGQDRWTVRPPSVKALNPIGSGDAMLAGIVAGLWRGSDLRDAVRLGVACGAANALTETAGVVRTADVRRLLREC